MIAMFSGSLGGVLVDRAARMGLGGCRVGNSVAFRSGCRTGSTCRVRCTRSEVWKFWCDPMPPEKVAAVSE